MTMLPCVPFKRSVVACIVALTVLVAMAPSAAAGTGKAAPAPTGYDVSYPQCNRALPAAAFGIVGVNNGIVFSANPCAGTGDGPSELAWAQAAANHAPAFYANTGDPGPAYSSHWPTGQTSPQNCTAAANNATACSYDYGWNAARDSFADALTAEQRVNGYTVGAATAAAARAVWWLDVETSNSWQTLESAYGQTATSRANDIADLDGAIAFLHSAGVIDVGLYSTAWQWTQITGGTGSHFAQNPDWVAGYADRSAARAACANAGFAAGPVRLTQYKTNNLDT